MDDAHGDRGAACWMCVVPSTPPPDDVLRLLHAHGARPVGPVGTDGSWWLARPADDPDGPWLEVLVADVPVDATLATRAGLLTALHHPHLARVRAVEPLAPGRVAVVCDHVPGPTLAGVRAARPPLADGEVVTVAVPVAQALGALHAAGLAHGAVGADRVVVGPGGVPVLVDLRGALRGGGTPTGDVHRLVATLLGVMPSLDVHLAAGVEEAAALRDALDALLRTPATGPQVVDAVFAAAEPAPLHVPEPDELAGAQVALAQGRTQVPRTAEPEPPRRRERRAGRGARRRPVLVAVVVAAAVLGGGVLVARPWTTGPGVAAPTSTAAASATGPADAGTDPLRDRADPAAAAVALTHRRTAALAAADGAAVDALTVPGSPAASADAALVARLAGARSEGLAARVASAVDAGTTADGDAVVAVTSALGAHVRVTPDGERLEVAGAADRTLELVLRWTDDGWRVLEVREPGAPT